MTPERFRQLTDGQRDCLRRVYQHRSSKEIARELHISKDTVDQRLDRARRLLGAQTRIEAARAFAEYEQCHRIVYHSTDLADSAKQHAPTPLIGREQGVAPTLREDRAAYAASIRPAGLNQLPIRARGEQRNDLTSKSRLAWIAIIAAAIPVLLGSLLAGLWVLGQIGVALTR